MSIISEQASADLTAAAKRRMERWLLSPDLQDHMQHAKHVRSKRGETGPYIAVSREAGSRGTEVAHIVGQQLGWDVLDKELLGFIAQRYQLPRDMLEIVDETRANWFHDVLGTFLDSRLVSQDSYVTHLKRVLYLAALYGNVVFVGRGAQCVLPRASGVAVRIIAPQKQRVEHMMQRGNLGRIEIGQLAGDQGTGLLDGQGRQLGGTEARHLGRTQLGHHGRAHCRDAGRLQGTHIGRIEGGKLGRAHRLDLAGAQRGKLGRGQLRDIRRLHGLHLRCQVRPADHLDHLGVEPGGGLPQGGIDWSHRLDDEYGCQASHCQQCIQDSHASLPQTFGPPS